MKEITSYNRAVQYLNKIFKHINTEFFNDSLEMPTADSSQPISKKKNSYQRWSCPCCHTIIRSTKAVNIICGDCGEHFIRDEKKGGL